MLMRDHLQEILHALIDPVVRLFIRLGVTPNVLTVTGALISLVAAAMIVVAGLRGGADVSLLTWSGIVMLAGSLFDMLDGQVARLGDMRSTFGALLDSVTDRYSEIATLLAITYFFFAVDAHLWALVAALALLGSVMVSYVRARAEGLALECKGGLMQRPERVVVIVVSCIAAGLTGEASVLGWGMALIALLANATAFWRVAHCRRQTR